MLGLADKLLLEHVWLPHVLDLTVHLVNFVGWMSQGGHSEPLLLLALFYWCTSSWTCRTTPTPWSHCPPGQFFGLDESRGSFWATFTFSTFLPEHSFLLKSYRWEMSRRLCGEWAGGYVVGWVAHGILLSPKSLWSWLWDFGLWDLGLGLDNCLDF